MQVFRRDAELLCFLQFLVAEGALARVQVVGPAEVVQVDRLALLDRLKRKYGPALEDVIKLGAEVTRKLSEIENKDEILRQLRTELAAAAQNYLQAARLISKKRYESAKKLEKLVEAEINELAMKSQFRIEISGTDEEGNWTASGFDQAEYLISTNPGERWASTSMESCSACTPRSAR